MKNDTHLKPIVITSHPANTILGGFMLLSGPFTIWLALEGGVTPTAIGCACVGLLGLLLGLALLIGPQLRRITVSSEGVTIQQKRSSVHVQLPWTNYRFAYRLSGYKVSYLLFAPDALTKQTQYEACNACMRSKNVPFVHGGFLALPGNLYYTQLLARLPESIRIVPEHECGTLWNKGRG